MRWRIDWGHIHWTYSLLPIHISIECRTFDLLNSFLHEHIHLMHSIQLLLCDWMADTFPRHSYAPTGFWLKEKKINTKQRNYQFVQELKFFVWNSCCFTTQCSAYLFVYSFRNIRQNVPSSPAVVRISLLILRIMENRPKTLDNWRHRLIRNCT